VIHDRDSIFSPELDKAVADMGVRILRTSVRAPKANSVCERLVGTLRRECPDFIIPLGERHLRRTLQLWTDHYNRGRPHTSLGPGIPVPRHAPPPHGAHRHRLLAGQVVRSRPVLGGLHHEYWLEKVAA
jgi:transposase InsO family protein